MSKTNQHFEPTTLANLPNALVTYQEKVFCRTLFWKTTSPADVTPSWMSRLLWSCSAAESAPLSNAGAALGRQKLSKSDENVSQTLPETSLFQTTRLTFWSYLRFSKENDSSQSLVSKKMFACWSVREVCFNALSYFGLVLKVHAFRDHLIWSTE